MSEKYSPDEMKPLVLANAFVTCHRFLTEVTALGAWVFASAKKSKDLLNVHPNEQNTKISMLSVKNLILPETARQSIKQNLSVFFDKDGVFRQELREAWRDITGYDEVIEYFKANPPSRYLATLNPDTVHTLNTDLVRNLSTDHRYVSFLKDSVREYKDADLEKSKDMTHEAVSEYLDDLVDYGVKCNHRYEANRIFEGTAQNTKSNASTNSHIDERAKF